MVTVNFFSAFKRFIMTVHFSQFLKCKAIYYMCHLLMLLLLVLFCRYFLLRLSVTVILF